MPKVANKEDIYALGANILVEMVEEPKENEAGILVPDMSNDRETCAMGKVLSSGLRKVIKKVTEGETTVEVEQEYPVELKLLETFGLRKGDVLLLKKFDYVKIKVENDEKDYRIYGINSIIAKVKSA